MMVCLANRAPLERRWSLSSSAGIVILVLVLSTETFASQNSIGLWHQVRKGDTVCDIAKEYRVSVHSIISTNKIRSAKHLRVGKKLLIPSPSGPQEEKGIWHHVQHGDTLWDLASKHCVSVQSIVSTNKIRSANRLRVGKKLLIPGASATQQEEGIWHHVQYGDTLWNLARRYGVPLVRLAMSNPLSSPKTLQVGAQLFVPGAQSTQFTAPLLSPLIVTSTFGYRYHPISKEPQFHRGVDLRARVKTRVYATKGGKVVRAGWSSGYGNVVVIKHDHEYTTWYAHLSSIWVKMGQEIKQNEAVGLSGRSGHATGPHLHFEVRRNGKSVNPSRYIGLP